MKAIIAACLATTVYLCACSTPPPATLPPYLLVTPTSDAPVPIATDPVTPIVAGPGRLPPLTQDLVYSTVAYTDNQQVITLMRYNHLSGGTEMVIGDLLTPATRVKLGLPERKQLMIRMWTSTRRPLAHMIFADDATQLQNGNSVLISVDLESRSIVRAMVLPLSLPTIGKGGVVARPATGIGSLSTNRLPYLSSPDGNSLLIFTSDRGGSGRGRGYQSPLRGAGPPRGTFSLLAVDDANSTPQDIARCGFGASEQNDCTQVGWLEDNRHIAYLDGGALMVAGAGIEARTISTGILSVDSYYGRSANRPWLLVTKKTREGAPPQHALLVSENMTLVPLPSEAGPHKAAPSWIGRTHLYVLHQTADGRSIAVVYAIQPDGSAVERVRTQSTERATGMKFVDSSLDSWRILSTCPEQNTGQVAAIRCPAFVTGLDLASGQETLITRLPSFGPGIGDAFVWTTWLPEVNAVLLGGRSDNLFVDLANAKIYALDTLLPNCACSAGVGFVARQAGRMR